MSRRRKIVFGVGALVVIGVAMIVMLPAAVLDGNGSLSRTTTYDVGEVVQGDTVEHVFVLSNDRAEDLVIDEVIPWASTVVRFDSVIPAGGEARVHLAMATDGKKGPVNEPVKVRFAGDQQRSIWLQLTGQIVAPVQIAPKEQVYFFTVKGENSREELEVINHLEEPVTVLEVSSSNPYFRPQVDEVRRGRRYRIDISLDPEVPTGRHEATLTITTDNAAYDSLTVDAWARVRDVVHTSISSIDFGQTELDALNLQALSQRSVLIEKHQGTDFQVTRATIDIPFIDVEVEPKEPGKSYLVRVKIARDRVQKVAFSGTLVIETNDPHFPRFTLPVTGELLESKG